DASIWQAATAVLLQNLENLAALDSNFDLAYAALYLDRVRQEIAGRMQQLTTRSMVGYIQMISQLGQLTAEMLSAMSIEQTAEILARHLPKVGIENALVTLYEGGSDDPPAQGKVLFGAGFKTNFGGLSFNPRAFPVANLYPATHPFQLTILPLTIDKNLSGFVAFDAPNPELCAALVHNLSAALRISLLYQDALDGRKMAEEANQLKSRFLSMVSHELRTPLSIIVGLSEMSLKARSIEMADLEQINISAQHLARLIGDVLDLASSEAGQLRILREPLDIIEVLRIAIKIGEKMAREKSLAWSVSLPEGAVWVLGDQTRLRQITLNLISNAIKFTSAGAVRVNVAVSAGEVSVSISDTGPGISSTEQKKIFNEFYRAERIIESGVSGIG
ncbi:HAMP domain-containing histidine kinase, partial [bacterium]|nr:HAMP domain-containing histidine kinase [bacterium]